MTHSYDIIGYARWLTGSGGATEYHSPNDTDDTDDKEAENQGGHR